MDPSLNSTSTEEYLIHSEQNISEISLKSEPCTSHDVQPLQSIPTPTKAVRKRNPRQCLAPGCTKCSQGFFFSSDFYSSSVGSTKYCIAHGGGRRCTFPGCLKAARDKQFCAAHGGGRRCTHPECKKAAVGGSFFCTSHGGGKKCSIPGCEKSAQSPTLFCVRHGGGKTCKREGCRKVARGRSEFCAGHGGGTNCRFPECANVAVSNHIFCREHRRQLKKIGMNVLKEGKTYYLSSVNSSFPLIPCDEALQYLKLSPPSDTLTGSITPTELMAYPPPNGYYTLPLSMIPIHTQSVLYPTMQYFPPLSSILPSSLPTSLTPSNLEPVEGDSDSSDGESDYSTQAYPTTTASAVQNMSFPADQSTEFGASLLYELSLPYKGYPVYSPNINGSMINTSNVMNLGSSSSIPLMFASLPEVTIQVANQDTPIGLDNSSVLLKRSREEYESNPQDHAHSLNHADGVFTAVPTSLSTMTNTLA